MKEGWRFVLPVAEEYPMTVEEPNASFDTLFDMHWRRVVAILARLTGDPDGAEDLSLEIFYKLYDRMVHGQKDRSPDGWLYRAAVNTGLNALRAGSRRQRYEWDAGMQLIEDAKPSPAAETEQREEAFQVQQILAEMQPRAARLLVLRSIGLSYQEVAQTLQVRVTSVGALLNRAEREFEKRYRRRFKESEDETSR